MNTASSSPNDIIDQMIELRMQFVEIERQINALKPAFYAACAAQEAEGTEFRRDCISKDGSPYRAVIYRRLSAGQWEYPDTIVEQEQRLKHLKKQFQAVHEPTSGREITWTVRLTTSA